MAALTSFDVRSRLLQALALDLVGPEPGSEHEREALNEPPSHWYLCGFLVPYEAPAEQRADESAREALDSGEAGPGDDEAAPEVPSARRVFLPSSLGLSVLVPRAAARVAVEVSWGDYVRHDVPEAPGGASREQWQRTPRSIAVEVPLERAGQRAPLVLPDSGGLRLVASLREVVAQGDVETRLPEGTRALSVFLVNHRAPATDKALRDETLMFQARLCVRLDEGFISRPDPRDGAHDDWDAQVADVQYRDVGEFAVGHGVATRAQCDADGRCRVVASTWLPTHEVERVVPARLEGVELRMEALAEAPDAAALRAALAPLAAQYRAWIERQREVAPRGERRGAVARALADDAHAVLARLDAGLDTLADPQVLDAFRWANRAMAMAARQRRAQEQGRAPAEVEAPRWHPFQIAFLLMNLRPLHDARHPERQGVDLLFFPTGGGKTEAYLGLAAFTLVLRRLRHPGLASAGVSVLMRYTLRLLTLDQLSRATTLVCALELMRRDEPRLGPWPFEIGLWVGRAATPNHMGRASDGDRDAARARTLAYQNDPRKPCPIPLENCPWCGAKLTRDSFRLHPEPDAPRDLHVVCMQRRCAFHGARHLPVVAVDDPLYRRLPCFLIATVDKFAGLPFEGRAGALFGHVERYDGDGFYGPCDPGRGHPLDGPLPPPDLVIQDELHLISGPLGTMVGLYETALDALATRVVDGREVRPRVVASTATVRRATTQIRALFAREHVTVFPPPGPDRHDSFFARVVATDEQPGRLYVGLAAPGRSPKVMLLRSYVTLLAAAQKAYDEGAAQADNPADPYMTLVGYFNALRELGGSRRIVEDEVRGKLGTYGRRRRRVGESAGLFADRRIAFEVVELTSRENTAQVAEAKRRLALEAHEGQRVDVALATNMISVGLDITRLGLMVVLGQPKTAAEYIQATSRVGRDARRPGLVLTLLNVHRPRDRSHFERFEAYHASFYRAVEATSVTPFAPRALDRGLAAVAVGLARHAHRALTPPQAALGVVAERQALGDVVETLAARSACVARDRDEESELREGLRARAADLLDEWSKIAAAQRDVGAGLQYQKYEATGPYLLIDPLDPSLSSRPAAERKFRAQRSLRDVEPSSPVWVTRRDGQVIPEDQA